MLFRFEAFELDADQLELRRGGEVRKVEPQVFSLLELLVANAHRMVSKEEINEQVWGGRIVSEAALSSRIRSARQAVDDDGRTQRLIKTIRDRGFRFVGEVTNVGTRPRLEGLPRDDDRSGEAQAVSPASIAVLPLWMLGDDRRYESLADAVSQEVITDLSRLRWLHVIARGSSFRFRGADVDAREVGRILGVRYVLSGSLALFEGKSLVSLELVNATDGSVVWADSIENPLAELLQVWRDIALRVASSIEGRIEAEEASRVSTLPTESLDAWAAYFRGLWHMYRFNAHDNQIAARLFERSLAADPRFARAHAGLSFTHFQDSFLGYRRDVRGHQRLALEHAQKACELDGQDAMSVISVGRAEMLRGRWEEAAPWFERSTALNPNFSWAFYHRALASAMMDDGQDGPDHATRAIALSPIDPLHYAMLAARGLGHIAKGEFEEACAWGARAARAPGAHQIISAIAAVAHDLAGDREVALRFADETRERDPRFDQGDFFRSFSFRNEATRARVADSLASFGF